MLDIDDVKSPRLQKEIRASVSQISSEFVKELKALDSLNLMSKKEERWIIYLLKNMVEEKVRKRANTKFL